MESIILLGVLAGICLIAYLLGLRDQKIAQKALVKKLKDGFGQAPNREYKQDDLDHIPGYYSKHKESFQIDDTTWNDLNMDGVFARMNYCLSATGEEYLYHMLRSPRQEDDFKDQDSHVLFFQKPHLAVLHFQKIKERFTYILIQQSHGDIITRNLHTTISHHLF